MIYDKEMEALWLMINLGLSANGLNGEKHYAFYVIGEF